MTNKSIDQIFFNSQLYIDVHWAVAQLENYNHEIDLVSQGVPYSELGISQRRHDAKSLNH